jgi:hypothetical protein
MTHGHVGEWSRATHQKISDLRQVLEKPVLEYVRELRTKRALVSLDAHAMSSVFSHGRGADDALHGLRASKPVLPKPPVPRSLSDSSSTISISACSTGFTTNWAMGWPGRMVMGGAPCPGGFEL